ncbi:uncharacterized protein LOC122668680 [Telopea speciosissima]|uniref:uncharacterized protein LOC122668680 n=1 Tax=Telopea speciosissima TaxID=54955 RepID=UPI001CC65310|nr:uncharacterized protein LOC122668680 [Telopea speciosissima]
MGKKKTGFGRRAWKLLRLAFLWGRKGGVFRSRVMMDLRLLTSNIKQGLLRHNNNYPYSPDRIHNRERQFSFDDTPIFHFKMQRPASMRFRIPCLNPPSVDFDFDFDDDLLYNNNNNNQFDNGRKSFLISGKEEEDFDDCDSRNDRRRSSAVVSCQEELIEEDEEEGGEIDIRAEEFIAKFYEQMKLQRQISYIQYNDMLNRGTN